MYKKNPKLSLGFFFYYLKLSTHFRATQFNKVIYSNNFSSFTSAN